jgi:hypothetical protein
LLLLFVNNIYEGYNATNGHTSVDLKKKVTVRVNTACLALKSETLNADSISALTFSFLGKECTDGSVTGIKVKMLKQITTFMSHDCQVKITHYNYTEFFTLSHTCFFLFFLKVQLTTKYFIYLPNRGLTKDIKKREILYLNPNIFSIIK